MPSTSSEALATAPPRGAAAEPRPGLARIAVINDLLDRAWRRGWLPRPPLEPAAILASARAKTGLAHAPDESGWLARLTLVLEAVQAEAALSPLGVTMTYGQLSVALANRLRVEALWRKHPEILEYPIAPPVVVLGQMRSGTTRVQRLLACDPRLATTRFFESWNPVPRAVRLGLLDDRRWRAGLALGVSRLLNPEFQHIHPTAVAAPDEEIGFHHYSIYASAMEAQWRIPRFAAAMEAADAHPVYAEFRRLLQTIAWLRREPVTQRWVLKVPQMTQDLAVVLDTFPGAALVCLDRDAPALVASAASLVESQMRLQSDAVDRHWIGREWLRKVRLRQERMTEARARADNPRVDVRFDAMNRDWRGEMARIYAAIGLTLTPEVEARMAQYLARPQHGKLARHRYGLADYGLSRAEVERVMAGR